jgi:hypothetical protein
MTELLEILKYTLPSIVVLLCAIFILKSILNAELSKRHLEMKGKISGKTIALRLQAYERVVLLLERISPRQLVFRFDTEGMDAARYQRILLQSVREEFEHNLAQQIYISTHAWSLVKSARESVLLMINQASGDLKDDASALDMATALLEMNMPAGNKQIDAALAFVKNEVRELF